MSRRILRSMQNFILIILALTLLISSCCLSQARMDIREIPASYAAHVSPTSDMVLSNDQLLSSPTSDLESELVKNARTRLNFFQESRQRQTSFQYCYLILTLLLLFFYHSYYLLNTHAQYFSSCALIIVRFIERSDGTTGSYQF